VNLSKPRTAPSTPQRPVREGVLAALWIPCDEEGALKRDALARHIAYLKGTGIHGILALGSTGEFVRMSLKQREKCCRCDRIGRAASGPRQPEFHPAGRSHLARAKRETIGRGRRRPDAPASFPFPRPICWSFSLRAADQVELPFYLYNFPNSPANRIDLETISAFADRANMAGINKAE